VAPPRRCDWAIAVPEAYQRYHDVEWGRPVHGAQPLFERISLEAFQAGLSWWSVLSRREALRETFENFDFHRLAEWEPERIEQALANPLIIRNRAKVKAVVSNARVVRELPDLDALIWSFAPQDHSRPRQMADISTQTPESVALAKTLKGEGVTFIGPVSAYALMQACGLVNDHLKNCEFQPE
jgi:DNA-3-methyladenine glycosylase I